MKSVHREFVPRHRSEVALLDAALHVIREKGYSAMRVDDVCAAAGLTKGGFFHHFAGKEDLALAAARYFGENADALFAAAPFRRVAGARERLLAYVDFRIAIIDGDLSAFTCLLGTMVQETYVTHPAIRDACDAEIRSHAASLVADIAEAKREHRPHGRWSAESLALHMQGVIQGAFILAKAASDPKAAVDSLRHLRRYLALLFDKTTTQGD